MELDEFGKWLERKTREPKFLLMCVLLVSIAAIYVLVNIVVSVALILFGGSYIWVQYEIYKSNRRKQSAERGRTEQPSQQEKPQESELPYDP